MDRIWSQEKMISKYMFLSGEVKKIWTRIFLSKRVPEKLHSEQQNKNIQEKNRNLQTYYIEYRCKLSR